jgi:hypothetical protein
MDPFQKLYHPVALIAQGFVVGAFAFALANPHLLDSSTPLSPDSAALVRTLTR